MLLTLMQFQMVLLFVKYKVSSSYGSKVMANVEVCFCHRQADTHKDRKD